MSTPAGDFSVKIFNDSRAAISADSVGDADNGDGELGESPGRYRVWLFTYGDWRPISCSDLPIAAIAFEAAEPENIHTPRGFTVCAGF